MLAIRRFQCCIGVPSPGLAAGLTLVGAFMLVACDRPASDSDSLQFFAVSAGMPATQLPQLTLVDDQTACMFDSYNVAIACASPDDPSPRRFGHPGPGPGELDKQIRLASTSRGELAVIDTRGINLFEPSGKYIHSIPIHIRLRPISGLDSVIVGIAYDPAPGRVKIVTARRSDGEIIDSLWIRPRFWPDHIPQQMPAFPFVQAALLQDEVVLIIGDEYPLQRFALSGEFLGDFFDPNYKPEPMSGRDRAEFVDGYRALFRSEPPSQMVRETFARSKPALLNGAVRAGPGNSIWVATRQDRTRYSFIKRFRNGVFVGSLRIEGRLLAFDLSASTMVVLVDQSDASALTPENVLMWYSLDGI
jgi:hypothetical protein